MNIRPASHEDLAVILNVHRAAFAEQAEEITALLQDFFLDPSAQPLFSLLAEQHGQAVGHVLLSPAYVAQTTARLLAPLAVVPTAQGQGIGGALVQAGLQAAAEAGIGLVFVLGYPSYYRRFGFRPAAAQGLIAPYPILEKNAEAWRVLELKAGVLGTVTGTVQCAKAIDKAEYWQE